MINRVYGICDTCSEKYIIRYNLGNQFPQRVSFVCDNCASEIEIGYDENRKTIMNGFQSVEGEIKGIIKNLHPEIVIDKDKINDPEYFPSLEFMIKEKNIFQFKEHQYSIDSYFERWKQISLNLRLLKDNKYNQLKNRYKTEDIEKISNIILDEIILCIDDFILGKWNKVNGKIINEYQSIKNTPKFKDFQSYLISQENDIIYTLFEIFSEYFTAREELLITLLAQKCEQQSIGLSSNISWKKIEMIYGNFYEIYANLLYIPTAINNIKKRGDYQLFNTVGFTFKNYLTIDKAGKTTNFLGNENLKDLGDYYYPFYRNGTHHKASKIDKEKQKITLMTGKSGTTETVLSYTEYIESCNEIYARILILLKLSIIIIKEK